MCSRTNDQLTGISDRSNWRDIRAASGFSTDKAEDEREDYAQESDANILLVLQAEDETGEESAENDTTCPHPPRYLLRLWCWVYDDQAFVNFLVLAEAADDGLEERVEGGDEGSTVRTELGECAAKEQQSAWPYEPLDVLAMCVSVRRKK